MLLLILTLASLVYLIYLLMIAAGYYKDPLLRHFERYAQFDDNFYMLPSLLLGVGLFIIFAGLLVNESIATRFPSFLLGVGIVIISYIIRERSEFMGAYPQIFLPLPRWYVELRERTTREERRRIAYMWLCLPRRMRLHLSGSDYHFRLWADQVILGTILQTVEDQEATATGSHEYVASRSEGSYHIL